MKHYFLIETTWDEWHKGFEYIAETLEEAEAHVMEYSDWYCMPGTCTIVEVDSKMKRIKEYRYREGKFVKNW